MKRAAVIGAGFGGLALAIRLQAAGIATTVIEARDRPGGMVRGSARQGFSFDDGPATLTDPQAIHALWALSGHDLARDVELLPVTPFSRLMWPDGTRFDLSDDDPAMIREIGALRPEDAGGYRRFLGYAAAVSRDVRDGLGPHAFDDRAGLARAAALLARHQAWRPLHALASRFVRDEHLREALSIQALQAGGNPMTASALYAWLHKLERDGGVWFPRGGMQALALAMARLFERLGGTLMLGDAAVEIETRGDCATGVRTASGWQADFDAVASNADVVASYARLLGHTHRGRKAADRLARRRFAPSAFVVHFGIEGIWPGIPHHSILFGPRYAGLFRDIYEHGVLSADALIHLYHPSVTDPGLALEGMSSFTALVPVPHLGKLPIDWDGEGEAYATRILDHVESRLIHGLRDRLVTRAHVTPADLGRDVSAHLGSAWSLEPRLSQSGWLRVHHRDDAIPNLYFVGAGTHPGAGIPAVIASAQATAQLMLEESHP
ncbi:phytoene desaturase family protein [Sphingomonas quercus]